MNSELRAIQQLLADLTGKVWASPRYQAFEFLKRQDIEIDHSWTNKKLVELLQEFKLKESELCADL